MRKHNIIFLQIALMVLTSSASGGSDEAALKNVQAAEDRYDSYMAEHDDGQLHYEQYKKVLEAEKLLLRVSANGVLKRPCSVYHGTNLEHGWELNGPYADDTIHTFEGSAITDFLHCAPNQSIKIMPAWQWNQLVRCDLYIGNTSEMHQSAYKNVIKLRRDKNIVHLPGTISDEQMILFAIIRTTTGAYFKFIFPIRNSQNTPAHASR